MSGASWILFYWATLASPSPWVVLFVLFWVLVSASRSQPRYSPTWRLNDYLAHWRWGCTVRLMSLIPCSITWCLRSRLIFCRFVSMHLICNLFSGVVNMRLSCHSSLFWLAKICVLWSIQKLWNGRPARGCSLDCALMRHSVWCSKKNKGHAL